MGCREQTRTKPDIVRRAGLIVNFEASKPEASRNCEKAAETVHSAMPNAGPFRWAVSLLSGGVPTRKHATDTCCWMIATKFSGADTWFLCGHVDMTDQPSVEKDGPKAFAKWKTRTSPMC